MIVLYPNRTNYFKNNNQSLSFHFYNLRVTRTKLHLYGGDLQVSREPVLGGFAYLLPILRVVLNFCYNNVDLFRMQTTILVSLLRSRHWNNKLPVQWVCLHLTRRGKNHEGLCFHNAIAYFLWELNHGILSLEMLLITYFFWYDKGDQNQMTTLLEQHLFYRLFEWSERLIVLTRAWTISIWRRME